MKSQDLDNSSIPDGITLYRFNGVPVVTKPSFWPVPILVTGFLAWMAGKRKPERSWFERLGVGMVALPIALLADIGHAMAHTVSARLAGAPMDEILLSSGMPRTLYENNTVAPKVHILRSLGGPIFSLASFIASLIWRSVSPDGSLSHDLAEVSLASHSFILLGSIAPLPIVDGGVILKWELVEAGYSAEQADKAVRKTSLWIGAAFLGLGALLGLFHKRKLLGGLLAAGGAAGIAAGTELLK